MDPIGTSSIGSSGSSVFSATGGSFGDNPFLEVLVSQLQNQTPLEPIDNNSFMEQMSSLSSMEEQRELNDNLLALLNYQGVLAKLQGLSEGSALLGKTVSFVRADGTEGEGIAESVSVTENGDVQVLVDGEEITFEQIRGVAETQP